jgi:antitoxin MazE
MTTKVKKWGNSLGIRFPQSLAKQAKINEGSSVEINYKKNKIEIIPI